jgi:hypothetical protein
MNTMGLALPVTTGVVPLTKELKDIPLTTADSSKVTVLNTATSI